MPSQGRFCVGHAAPAVGTLGGQAECRAWGLFVQQPPDPVCGEAVVELAQVLTAPLAMLSITAHNYNPTASPTGLLHAWPAPVSGLCM